MTDPVTGQSTSTEAGPTEGLRLGRLGADLAGGGWRFGFGDRVDALRLQVGLAFEREMEAGRGFLWLPVAFGAGILVYFALPHEPSILALAGLALALAVAVWRMRLSTAVFRLLVVLTAISAGVLTAKVRTETVAAVPLMRDMTLTVTGWIAAKEEAARGGERVLIRVHHIDEIRVAAPPETVRVTIRSRAGSLAVGDAVTVLARLRPPPGPVMPGGYDFARAAYYQGIGAVGFAYGAAEPADIGPAPLGIRLAVPLAHLRDTIQERIEQALPGDNGHIAAALIMGDRGGISEDTQEAMRASGLGHILAISGLHMALVAGTAFWLIRALLALSTTLALTRPIKKWAAAGALVVAGAYLGISGAGIATQRAFIMLAVMLIAVMIDRRAITLRNVAIAALIVLILSPESLLTASFQMSFAATVALVSGYEAIGRVNDRRLSLADRSDPGLTGRVTRWIGGLFVTSLIAGLATAPFAAYHFHRLAPLTLLANLAAMPAVALIVMPMALFAVLMMPFGLEVLPLTVMNWGLDWVVAVARTVSSWSAGIGGVRAVPAGSVLLIAAGFLWLTLWRERWRLAGIVPIVLAVPVALSTPRPSILVSEGGAAAAVRGEDGRYRILGGRGARFEIENWLRADSDPRTPADDSLAEAVACDQLGCVTHVDGGGEAVALSLDRAGLAEDCRMAAVVITRFDAPAGCAEEAQVMDRTALARFGAHALYRREAEGDGAAFRVETAYPATRRPFMPALPPDQ